MKRINLFLFSALLVTSNLSAIPVDLIFRSVQSSPIEAVAGTLTVTQNGDTDGEVGSFVRQVEIPGTVTLDLDTETVWRAVLEAPGFWSEPRSFSPEPQQPVGIRVWPTAEVRGLVNVPRGEAMPSEIAVRFEAAPDSEWFGKLPRTQVDCPIEEGRWKCEIPAINADLRMRCPGFISHFFWDFPLSPGGIHQFGNLRLRRGASLVGQVGMLEGSLPEKIEIKIAPMVTGGAPSPADLKRLDAMGRTTEPDERGFFHLEGIRPGSYVLTGNYPGGAPTRVFPVNIFEHAETEVAKPIILSPPLTLEVHLVPALDMEGKPWTIELLQISALSGITDKRLTGKASETGLFEAAGLAPSGYLIRVGDTTGNVIASENFDLTPSSTRLEIELPLVMVEGKILFGSEPLLADLLFGGQFSPKQIHLPSDHNGNFFGYLPHDGEWLVYLTSEQPQIVRNLKVDVDAEEGLAEVVIRLPETRVSGRVVMPDGTPLQGLARAYDPMIANWVVQRTDEEGRFLFEGLPEGLNILVADSGRFGASAEVRLDVVAKLDPAPEIVVPPFRHITGTIVGPNGPIANALVKALEYEASNFTPRLIPLPLQTRTTLDGKFDLRTTASSDRLQLIVYPPGYALSVSAIMSLPDESVTVPVDQTMGTVVFELEGPFQWADRWGPRPSLWIDGIPYDFTTLTDWMNVNNVRAQGKEFMIPALPPGQVRACFIAPDPENISGVPEPEVGDCREGFLSPGGELRFRFTSD